MPVWRSRSVKWKFLIPTGLVVVAVLGVNSMAYAQLVRSCGTPSPLGPEGVALSPGLGAATPSGAGRGVVAPTTPASAASFDVLPSICVSERYDSNVFFAPKTPGLTRNDFVTNVNPNLRIKHSGDYLTGVLDAGGFNETYVNNPDLNFFGSTGNLSLNLDKSIKRLLPNASLRIDDYVRYTPLPAGLASSAPGTSPGAPVNQNTAFAQGLLAQRTNNVINGGTAVMGYDTTASTSVNASYSYALLRYGSSPVTSQVTLFDTTTQTGAVQGIAKLSGLDTVNVKYSHTQSQFSSNATSSLFKADTATLGWSRTIAQGLTAEVGGGGIIISPGFATYAANAALILRSQSNSVTLSYARTAFPSFTGVGAMIVGDMFTFSAVQNLGLQWQLVEAGGYAHSSGGGGNTAITYDTYSASVDLYYWISRNWSTALSYDYLNYYANTAGTTIAFPRSVVALAIKAVWG